MDNMTKYVIIIYGQRGDLNLTLPMAPRIGRTIVMKIVVGAVSIHTVMKIIAAAKREET